MKFPKALVCLIMMSGILLTQACYGGSDQKQESKSASADATQNIPSQMHDADAEARAQEKLQKELDAFEASKNKDF